MRMFRTGLVLGLLLTVSACDSTETASPSTSVATTVVDATTSTTIAPDTSEPTTTEPTGSTTTTPTVTTVVTETTAAPTTAAPTPVDVKVYMLRDERLVIAHRDVHGPAVMRAALDELLAGPTDDERDGAGLLSSVPIGTELRDLNLVDGLATIDLSSEFESGGGSLSMMSRIAQIVFTATQFENVDRVEFWLDGAPVESIGGEGIMVDEPLTRASVDRYVTGSVIIDTPAYGATVRSPFTVTGEGDVFEAQFPIEVWANGEQIGGLAPVTAGAWGDWADFEVTITLDAAPGPIELIAYDPGGCGTEPECPTIIKTIVPLTLTN
jgi:spore germination protein GerM